MVPEPSSAATRRIDTAPKPAASAMASAADAIFSRLNRGLRAAGAGLAQMGPGPEGSGTYIAYIVRCTEYAVPFLSTQYAKRAGHSQARRRRRYLSLRLRRRLTGAYWKDNRRRLGWDLEPGPLVSGPGWSSRHNGGRHLRRSRAEGAVRRGPTPGNGLGSLSLCPTLSVRAEVL